MAERLTNTIGALISGARHDAVLIAGPTASGKSALALDIARALGGVIINADSMQVYEDLTILTARPTAAQQAEAPHRLYGVLAGDDPCSAGRYADMAAAEVKRAHAHGLIPVLVGGTGLYFRALLEGIAPIPDIDAHVRAEARARFDEIGAERFRAVLGEIDPGLVASLGVLDPQRMIRAYEVHIQTGKPLSYWQALRAAPVLNGNILKLVVEVERTELYRRCNARFLGMIEQGALQEVNRLVAKELSRDLPVMKAVGVRELAAHLESGLSLEEACGRAQTATRRLAKRQLTWAKSYMLAWEWVKA